MKKTKLFHKILAFTLILSILFSMFVFGPVINVIADENNTNTEEIDVWSGEIANDFAGGSGTKADPFLIDNGEQLYLMVKVYSDAKTASGSVNTKTYFKLRKDIYLNNVTDADLKNPTVESWNSKGFNQWFTLTGTSVGFCGDLDGDGHTIHGLYAYGGYAALIPLLADGGNVHNLNLKNSFIYGNTNGGAAGGIIGYVYSYWKLSPVTVSNCLVDNIVVDGSSARTGGIVGGFYNIKVTVTNCAVINTTLKSHSESYPDYVSGIVGCNNSSENLVSVVTNCYTDGSVHPVNATSDKTNFDIIDDKVTYTNVYTSATKNFDADEGVIYLTEAEMQGEAAKANMTGFDFKYDWVVVDGDYPVLTSNPIAIWDGTKLDSFDTFKGKGTPKEPYLIENGAQLAFVLTPTLVDSQSPIPTGLYFELANDIRLNYTAGENWKENPNINTWGWADARFVGDFNGNGHTIDGMYYIATNKSKVGLFPYVGDSLIHDFTMSNAYVSTTVSGVAIVAGQASASTSFERVFVDQTCEINAPNSKGVAGIVAYTRWSEMTVDFKYCGVLAKISGLEASTGAFFGFSDGTNKTVSINNSFSASNVKLSPYALTDSANNYSLVSDTDGTTVLTENQMKGEAAKSNMPALDFKYDWVIVKNDYPVLTSNPVPIWDGTKLANFDTFKGEGTPENPYQIENGAQLAYVMTPALVNNKTPIPSGLYYELSRDIRLNYTAGADWKANANSWGWADARFVGDFNGNGHIIDGLYTDTGHYRFALIPYIGDSFIYDFSMTNAYINNQPTTSDKVGVAFVVGQTSAATKFEGIYIDDSCYLTAASGVTGVAGLVGRCNYKAEIVNCAVNATITGSSQVGAFLGTGTSNASTISNSYTATNLPLFGNPDGIFVTYVNAYSLADGDKYATKVNSAEDMKGDAVKVSMPGLGFGRNWKIVANDYPQPVAYVSPDYVWDGSVADSFADDSAGTKEDPFIIENGAQLKRMIELYGNLTTAESAAMEMPYFKIVKDIYLNDVNDFDMTDPTTASWDGNGFNPWVTSTNASKGFYGSIDGGGHTIYGLYCKDTGHGGLIPVVVSTASVTNLRIEKSFVSIKNTGSYPSPAAIIGLVNGGSASVSVSYCVVNNCDILAAASTWRIGAVVGGGSGTCDISVSDCAVTNIKMETLNNQSGYENRTCAFIGNTSGNKSETTVTNCFTDSSTHPVTNATTFSTGYKVIDDNKTFTNVYTTATDPATYLGESFTTSNNIIYLDNDEMLKGEAARTNMPALVFGAVWETVEDGYPVIVKNPIESWDGKPADKFAAGNGTAENPYIIENGGQLYKMVSEYGNMNVARKPADQTDAQPHFRITKDINLGNVEWYKLKKSNVDNLTNGNFTTGFNGVIYGEGHTIYGLNVNGSYAYPVVALIPVVTQGAEIYDLHMSYGTAKSNGWNGRSAAALVGLAVGYPSSKPVVIDRCSVDNFNIQSVYGSAGFVGYIYAQSVSITNSYCKDTTLSTSGTNDTVGSGPFFAVARGNSEGNKILVENCYGDDVPSAVRFLEGGFDAATRYNSVYTLDSTYNGTSVTGLIKVTATQLQGANAKETLSGFNFNQVWACGSEGEYPVHKAYNSTIWNGREASAYAGGEGTAESPYEIATAEQLYKLANADTASTKGKYFKLTADITISDIYDGWTNDNPYTWAKKTAYLTGFTYGNSFAGTLDGDGHTVTGLYIAENITDGGTYTYGLIPFVSTSAVVKNINIDKVKIDVDGNAYVGAVVGAAYSKGNDATNPIANAQIVGANITNCDITTTNAETTGDIIGGAVGGVKVELCNQESKPDVILTYTENNLDEAAILNIRGKLLGKNDDYITDINAKEGFNVCDLLHAKIGLLPNEDVGNDEYEVVWSQDFNGDELDYSVWSRNTTMSRGTTIKYGDLNRVNGESLTLYCEDTKTTNDAGNKIYNVNYGLDTMNSMSFKYGKLTMRAKLPLYAGAFPSLWLTSRGAIGNETLTPYSAEIDIFEIFGNGDYDIGDGTWNHTQMVGCIHKWYNDENGNTIKDGEGNIIDCSCGTSAANGNNYFVDESDRSTYVTDANKWYIIEFEWTEDQMTCSVTPEGGATKTYYTVSRAEIEGQFGLTDREKDAAGIFDQFFAIKINNHMYTEGNEVYRYSDKFYAPNIDASKLNYEIDYIKLEQKNDGKSAINLK